MWHRLFALVALVSALALLAGCADLPPTSPRNQGEATLLPSAAKGVEKSKVYEVVERMTVVNRGPGEPSKHNLWVALIQDQPPYQEVLSRTISPDDYTLVTDEYGNQYAEFDFAGMAAGTSIPVEIQTKVRVNDVTFDLAPCEGALPDFFTDPDLHIEANNPQIIELASQLAEGKANDCEIVRAFYDYIGDNLLYSYNGASWGAQAALGEMGADCTEYASLLIALSRAAGIPARYLEGLYHNGGQEEALARREHAWVEVYLPGAGWTLLDPTLGRSALTRDAYFAHAAPDHIIVTRGRNPSTLRGGSYFTHLYWPGQSMEIRIEGFEWNITPAP
ncbi:MAG TPA: transglutaminase family protein [Caldilineae bacterium]|nr:transglutaminase family protein [Caldilineae bacterium]